MCAWVSVRGAWQTDADESGHTTTYWKDDKLIIFGGENEQRVFLSDVYIFDIRDATWSQPVLSGHPPCGRSRHAVVLHDDKLFILGGVHNNPRAPPADYDPDDETEYNPQEVLDDICYLDLKTMTWSRSWKWVARFDHQAWVREGKMWIFGGMGKEMDRTGELVSLDLTNPVFARTESKPAGYTTRQPRTTPDASTTGRVLRSHRSYGPNSPRPLFGSRRNTPPPKSTPVPASTSAVRFLWGRDIPSEAHGTHFHHLCGSTMLDFVTSANTIGAGETALCALDLRELTWRKIADGTDVLGGGSWRWHYLAIAPNSTMAYLLGCPTDAGAEELPDREQEEFLSDVLPLDLSRFGLHPDPAPGEAPIPGQLGWDLAAVFDRDDAGADFIIRAMKDEATEGDEYDLAGLWGQNAILSPPPAAAPSSTTPNSTVAAASSDLPPESVLAPPIRVHKLILLARWRHFTALHNARMREFHAGTMYLPEPYSVVRAFLYYLYTDSVAQPDLSTVAGLLVMSNLYDIPQLRTLCLARLYAELDVDSAALVWERAGVAGEEQLRRKAASFVLAYWGRVVRTAGFRRLGRRSLMELCEEVDEEGRVLGGEELQRDEGGPAEGKTAPVERTEEDEDEEMG